MNKKSLTLFTVLFRILLVGQNPAVDFTASITGNSLIVIPSATTLVTGTNTFTFDYGDGTAYTGTTLPQQFVRTYTTNGLKSLSLSLSNDSMLPVYHFQTVQSAIPGCSLNVSVNNTGGLMPDSVASYTSIVTGQSGPISYQWQFNDGSISNLANPTVTFQANGAYFPMLTVIENASCAASYDVAIDAFSVVAVNIFNYSISVNQSPGGAVSFTLNNAGPGLDIFWQLSPQHWEANKIYTSDVFYNGTYSVTATVLFFGTLTAQTVITVTDNPCSMVPSISYTNIGSGQIAFTASAPTSTNSVFLWDFDDGDSSVQFNPIHTYTSAGSYWVKLTETDTTSHGQCFMNTSENVTITGIPCLPVSSFVMYTVSPQNYVLINTYPHNISSLLFDWGDGATSNFLWGSHTYSAAGVYSICMTVTAACGSSTMSCVNQFLSRSTAADMLTVTVVPWGNSTGITKQSQTSAPLLQVFPIPANEQLHIAGLVGIARMEIKNLLGETLLRQESGGSELESIDTDRLCNGIYFLSIQNEHSNATYRFVIAH